MNGCRRSRRAREVSDSSPLPWRESYLTSLYASQVWMLTPTQLSMLRHAAKLPVVLVLHCLGIPSVSTSSHLNFDPHCRRLSRLDERDIRTLQLSPGTARSVAKKDAHIVRGSIPTVLDIPAELRTLDAVTRVRGHPRVARSNPQRSRRVPPALPNRPAREDRRRDSGSQECDIQRRHERTLSGPATPPRFSFVRLGSHTQGTHAALMRLFSRLDGRTVPLHGSASG